MDYTIWQNGDEVLRTRNASAARRKYREVLSAYLKTVYGHVDRQLLAADLADFDEAASTLGVMRVGREHAPSGSEVLAMFHR